MDTPSHFFNDSVDLEAPSLFGAPPDCDFKEDNLDEHALMIFPPNNSASDLPVSTASKAQEPRSGVWASGAIDSDLFAEPNSSEQGMRKIKQEEPEHMEDAINVALPTCSTPSSRRGSSSKSIVDQPSSTSASISTDTSSPPAQVNVRKRKTQAVLKVENDHKSDEFGEAGDAGEKRQKFLERNRVAATKCRLKKKQWIAEMEEKGLLLENQKAYLESQRDSLLDEIKGLKYLLMMHAKCNDPSIDTWLKGEAQRFVSEQSDRFIQFPQAVPPGYAYGGPSDAQSQSSPMSNAFAFPGGELDGPAPMDRRGSIAYSHTSTVQTTSPIDAGFPLVASPRFKIEEGDDEINLDHMPDSMFCSEQALFLGA